MLKEAARVVRVIKKHSFFEDYRANYVHDVEVAFRLNKITELFIEEDHFSLRENYHDHKLKDELSGFRSVELFPEIRKDVVIVYETIDDGTQIDFHRIGDHNWVYAKDYEKQAKKRRMKNRRIRK